MTNNLFDLFIPIALAVIMFGIGLALTPADFVRLLQRPRALLVGSLLQFALLPLFALACVHVFGLAGLQAVGVMMLSACAGGAIGIVIVKLARADAALAVALTALSILWSAFSIPASLAIAIPAFMSEAQAPEISLRAVIARVAAVTLLPVACGMLLRRLRPGFAQVADAPLRLLSSLFLALLMGVILVTQFDQLVGMLSTLGAAMFSLSAALLAAGLVLARGAGLSRHESIAIALQASVRNTATAIFVATSLLARPEMSIPAVVYTITAFIVAALLVAWARLAESPARSLAAKR